jgi:hypothetical protein
LRPGERLPMLVYRRNEARTLERLARSGLSR